MGDNTPKQDNIANHRPSASHTIRGLAGAFIGAGIGYWLFMWCMRQGYVVLPLPGVLIGFGRDLATRHRSWPLGLACLALAVAIESYIIQTVLLSGFRGMGFFLWGAFLMGGAFALWFGLGKIAQQSTKEK